MLDFFKAIDYKYILEITVKIFKNSIVQSVLIVAAAFAVYKIISALFKRASGKNLKKIDRKKSETYLRLINSIVKYALLIITFFLLLSVNKVNITSMVAGLGIAGVILGFAVQDALKDVIRGFDIISDNYFKVGDLVDYKGTEGVVQEIGIKTTKIKDIKTENIISIPNRNIEAVARVSKYVYIEIPLPYETPLETARDVVKEICGQIEKSSKVSRCESLGVTKLDDSAIKHFIRLECKDNGKKLQVRRDALGEILSVLEARGISVPYNQLDIHTK